MATVAILMPRYGNVDPRIEDAAIHLTAATVSNGVKISDTFSTKNIPIVHDSLPDRGAREILANRFLLESKAEWSFWYDADVIVPPFAILAALNAVKIWDVRFVSGIIRSREDGHNLAFRKNKSGEYESVSMLDTKQQTIDACTLGCALIHRSVFSDLSKPWFPGMPEDLRFCEKVREARFIIILEPEIRCQHILDSAEAV